METFVDIISDIGAQISKIKRCRINQQTLITSHFLKPVSIFLRSRIFNTSFSDTGADGRSAILTLSFILNYLFFIVEDNNGCFCPFLPG